MSIEVCMQNHGICRGCPKKQDCEEGQKENQALGEIEYKIALGEMTAEQVFTQMKQLIKKAAG